MNSDQISEFLLCGATVLPPFLLQADEFILALGSLVLLLVAGCLVKTLDPHAPFRRTGSSSGASHLDGAPRPDDPE